MACAIIVVYGWLQLGIASVFGLLYAWKLFRFCFCSIIKPNTGKSNSTLHIIYILFLIVSSGLFALRGEHSSDCELPHYAGELPKVLRLMVVTHWLSGTMNVLIWLACFFHSTTFWSELLQLPQGKSPRYASHDLKSTRSTLFFFISLIFMIVLIISFFVFTLHVNDMFFDAQTVFVLEVLRVGLLTLIDVLGLMYYAFWHKGHKREVESRKMFYSGLESMWTKVSALSRVWVFAFILKIGSSIIQLAYELSTPIVSSGQGVPYYLTTCILFFLIFTSTLIADFLVLCAYPETPLVSRTSFDVQTGHLSLEWSPMNVNCEPLTLSDPLFDDGPSKPLPHGFRREGLTLSKILRYIWIFIVTTFYLVGVVLIEREAYKA